MHAYIIFYINRLNKLNCLGRKSKTVFLNFSIPCLKRAPQFDRRIFIQQTCQVLITTIGDQVVAVIHTLLMLAKTNAMNRLEIVMQGGV